MERVVNGLECCFNVQSGWKDAVWVCPACPYAKNDGEPCETLAPLLDDALTLLKAQEALVMTLEEALGAEVNVDQCWLEVRSIKQIYLADAVVCPEHPERADIQRWGASDCQLPLDLYGGYWRMWTSKPTDEQREKEPWNG